MNVMFRRLRDVKLPSLGTENSAGWDFFVPSSFVPLDDAALKIIREDELDIQWENFTLWPQEQITIPSGLQMYMRREQVDALSRVKRFHLELFNRSSLAKQGLVMGAQVVDEDYEGELHFQIWNVSQQTIVIKRGQKIAQGIFRETVKPGIYESETNLIYPASFARGKGGFGSTGK